MTENANPTTNTLKYGDTVIYEIDGQRCNALVLQSQLVSVPDRSGRGGQSNEEHLVLAYLHPNKAKPQMTQTEMDAATCRDFGVRPLHEGIRTGWIRAATPHPAEAAIDEVVGKPESAYSPS
jgi:hypothetical protein